MFAKTKGDALCIANKLLNYDDLIGEQGVIYRKYVPLETYEVGLNGLPFTNEWRFFFYKKNLLSYGYYWSIADDTNRIVEEDCIKFAQKIANIVSKYTNFYVLDVAKATSGDWILIEINDGQMSGLSMNDPDTLYKNLSLYVN